MFLSLPTGTLMVLIWVAVIIFAAAIEAGTMDLSSIWFSAGALFALIVSLIFPDEIWLQVVIFLVVSIILLIVLRPIFKEHMRKNQIKTNADSLIGKIAVCTKEIKDGNRGEVKIEGKIWTAVSNENIELNEKVTVLAIKGVKLVVRKN